LVFGDGGEIDAVIGEQRSVHPSVVALGVRMDGAGNELLPVGEHLDPVSLEPGRSEVLAREGEPSRNDLVERLVGAERQQGLRELADPDR
jgi:hypothetical protein